MENLRLVKYTKVFFTCQIFVVVIVEEKNTGGGGNPSHYILWIFLKHWWRIPSCGIIKMQERGQYVAQLGESKLLGGAIGIMVKKVIISIFIMAVIGLIIYRISMPLKSEVYTVEPKMVELYFMEVGTVIGSKSVSVYSVSKGKLISVDVTEGQRVKEDDVICRIDPSEYNNAIANLEISIAEYQLQAQTQINMRRLIVSENEKNLQNERENFKKNEELYISDAISKNELDLSRLQLDSALSILQQSKEQLTLIETGGEYATNIKINQLQIEQLRQNIEDCVIKAPMAGIITDLAVEDFNLVTDHMLIATVEADDTVEIEVPVNTNDIDLIRVDDAVELILRRRDGDIILDGKISKIDNNAQIKVTPKGNEESVVKVRIAPIKKNDLSVGHDIDVKFCYYKEYDQLAVPKSAVFVEGEDNFVWAVKNGKLMKSKIQVKKSLRTEISVSEGIYEGDVIIINSESDGLKEGKRVEW
jgi:multidrug efflux pump subunit AcrA (membrane-fusion protein)